MIWISTILFFCLICGPEHFLELFLHNFEKEISGKDTTKFMFVLEGFPGFLVSNNVCDVSLWKGGSFVGFYMSFVVCGSICEYSISPILIFKLNVLKGNLLFTFVTI